MMSKLATIIVVCLISVPLMAAEFGNSDPGSMSYVHYQDWGNEIVWGSFSCGGDGTADSIYAMLNQSQPAEPADSFKCAVFDNSGNYLGTTEQVVLDGADLAWVGFEVVGTINLTSGTTYRLAVWCTNNGTYTRIWRSMIYGAGTIGYDTDVPYDESWPATVTQDGSQSYELAIYCVYTPAASEETTSSRRRR